MDLAMNDGAGVDDLEAFLNLDDQLGSNFSLSYFDHNGNPNVQDYEQLQQQHHHQQQQQQQQQRHSAQATPDGFQDISQGFDMAAHQQMHGQPTPMNSYGHVPYGHMGVDALAAAGYPHHSMQKAVPSNSYHNMAGAPPTPHSAEMHAKPAPFQQGRGNPHFVHRNGDPVSLFSPSPQQSHGLQLRAQNAFTPHLSPELDGSASVMSHAQGYTTPGMYNLSPLTSPAIGPQLVTDPRAIRSNPMTANGSLVGSPNDVNMEDAQENEAERPRKTRKKAPAPRKPAASSAPRQRKTPINTPRMKASLNLSIPDANTSSGASSESPFTGEAIDGIRGNGSASSSISPRPLADAVMRPPPKPHTPTAMSTQQSQSMENHNTQQSQPPTPQDQNAQMQQNGRPLAAPATPTSMMRLRSPQVTSGSGTGSGSLGGVDLQSPSLEYGMDFLKLPESATAPEESTGSGKAAALPKLKTKMANDSVVTDSPRTSAVASPVGPQGSSKTDPKANRVTKKRGSSSSNLVSPALRPKVSPNVKPLLPEGTPIDSQTHALLLASRSNYENILSGSHLPGVSYPADLSANLTSKRTSHKIAEQGRRNRINLALQEMQTLLPAKYNAIASPPSKPADASDKNGSKTPSTPTQGGSSKAATVECAIDYIKTLQQDSSQKDVALELMRQEIEKLRRQTGQSSSGK